MSQVYAVITQQIIESMEKSGGYVELPWHHAGAKRPANIKSKKTYRGVNVLNLWLQAMHKGYGSNQWGTYKQWNELDAQVRKGERSSTVVFYKIMESTGSNATTGAEEINKWPMARLAFVFNRDQVDGLDDIGTDEVEPIESSLDVDLFVENTGAVIKIGGGRAAYSPSADCIYMPDKKYFISTSAADITEGWYSTLLHELTHWTSNTDRCNRTLGSRFGDNAYAMEELVAELGAAYLCGDLGISASPCEGHAHYLKSWIRILKEDNKAIFSAASLAEKAVGYLHECQMVQDKLARCQ